MINEILKKLTDGKNLEPEEAHTVMEKIMKAEITPVQTASLLVALKMKEESVEEITEFAKVMRETAVQIQPKSAHLVDTCGTGGDSSFTFNISTASAFIAAGAGVSIAKHGNRSVSGKCGSADVLEQLGA
ncbi:anthranilate phosphoribosyltransferase, partial [Candidatus Micrarchaeota archaeon]|nr:anthranilate phosphoribosyltransferase [Candidatus Micrarchaeota archaeon]